MAYPGRPVLEPLPQFRGTNIIRQTPEQRRVLLEYVSREYAAGRSLRELAELTDRTQAAVRRALDQAGVRRRGPGAPPLAAPSGSPRHH
ncbi:helix-turn-helix domain-containing protein [Knoellia aerolata]|uniref:helix-turn-helix domain-containing protein n=1 Tax=Knoellia aerolata TaxID=442954 RepID=UPI000A018C8A